MSYKLQISTLLTGADFFAILITNLEIKIQKNCPPRTRITQSKGVLTGVIIFKMPKSQDFFERKNEIFKIDFLKK
jgi:hypothetical protein